MKLAPRLLSGLDMRMVLVLLVAVSSSSCAMLGLAVGIGSATIAANAPDRRGAYWREGVERERRYRVELERDAIAARKRYRASQVDEGASSRPETSDAPTPPPLVPFEPPRRPLVPR